jgi:hypothetical protein
MPLAGGQDVTHCAGIRGDERVVTAGQGQQALRRGASAEAGTERAARLQRVIDRLDLHAGRGAVRRQRARQERGQVARRVPRHVADLHRRGLCVGPCLTSRVRLLDNAHAF